MLLLGHACSRATQVVREGWLSSTASTVLQPSGPVPRAAAGVGAGAWVEGTVVPTEAGAGVLGEIVVAEGPSAWEGARAEGVGARPAGAGLWAGLWAGLSGRACEGARVGAAARGNWKMVGMVPVEVAVIAPLQQA